MPLRKHEPIDESRMNDCSPRYSICEMLRMIYHKTDDEEIKLNCRIATSMAKAMDKKIGELSENTSWFLDFWDKKKGDE